MSVKVMTAWALVLPMVSGAASVASTRDIPAPPTSCAIQRLGEPAGSTLSIVTGADPTGRYLVGRGYPDDPNNNYRRDVVLWDNSRRPTPVDVPGIDQQLADINSSGVAVGSSYDPDTWGLMTPWIYRNGKVKALPGVGSGDAVGINERGQIAGNRDGEGDGPVWWPDSKSRPVDLKLPEGAVHGRTHDIDTDGTIVGVVTDADFVDRAYVWRPDGVAKQLPLPSGHGPMSRAFGIRNGWITGLAGGPDGIVALRWHLRSGEVRVYPEFDIRADAANRYGWLVGSSVKGKGLFVSDTNVLSLPGLADHNEPLGDIAVTISDDARVIAGQALDSAGNIRAVRWRCGR